MERKLWVGLLLLVSAGLAAQEGAARITIFGSGSLPIAERNFSLFGEGFRTEYDNGAKVGLRGTVDLSSKWALEGTYGFGQNTWRVTEELGAPTAEHRAFVIHRHQLTGGLLRYLNNRSDRVNFFVVVGGGLARFSPTDGAKARAAHEFVNNPAPDIQASNQWSVHAGAGLEAKLSSHWGLRIDVEDHVIPVPRFGLPKNNPGGGADFYPQSGVIQDIEPSVGIVYRWK
ncbi:MAG: porin family protein [Acidobacteriales bacterium]|nr:porin family protein [Terriglobales bacterium]